MTATLALFAVRCGVCVLNADRVDVFDYGPQPWAWTTLVPPVHVIDLKPFPCGNPMVVYAHRGTTTVTLGSPFAYWPADGRDITLDGVIDPADSDRLADYVVRGDRRGDWNLDGRTDLADFAAHSRAMGFAGCGCGS